MTCRIGPAAAAILFVVGGSSIACNRDPVAKAQKFVASGDAYAARGALKEAIIQYRSALEYQPRAAATHVKLGLAYEQLDDTDQAFTSFARAAQLDSSRVDAHVRVATALLAAGRFSDAQRFAEQAASREPRSVQALAVAAAALAGQRHLTEANRRFDEALKIDPRSSFAHRVFGTALVQIGSSEEGRQALQRAVEYDEGSVDAWTALGQAAWRSGAAADAERAFERALALRPESTALRRLLASFYVSAGRADRAESQLRALASAHAEDRLALIDYYLSLDRDADAARELEALAADKTLGGAARLRRAALAYRGHRTEDAERELAPAFADKSLEPDARLLRSRFRLQASDTAGALQDAERADALRPDWAEAAYLLGLIHLTRGETTDAEQHLRRARARGGNRQLVDLALARVALAANRPGEAAQFAEQVIAAAPSADAYVVLANALRSEGRMPQARAALDAARPRYDSAELDVERGNLELTSRHAAAALAAFEHALQHAPASADARAGVVESNVAAGRPAAARASVDAFRAASPDDVRLMMLSAWLDALSGKWPEAEQTLLAARRQSPNDPQVLEALAQISLGGRNMPAAAQYLEQAAARRIRPVADLVALGMLKDDAGDRTGAGRAYERALEFEPREGVAANNLAWIYAEQGRLAEALDAAQKAQQAMPNLPQSLHTLGWMHHLSGNDDLAIGFLRRAADREPRKALYHRDLATLYQTRNRPADAERELAAARKLSGDPGAPAGPRTPRQ